MRIIKSLFSKDKVSSKHLQKTEDNYIIETGYYNLDEHVICISSQVGCSMGCIFCASTDLEENVLGVNKGFIRNLTSDEIIQQCENIISFIGKKELDSKKILFSYMGVGEPFLNYNNMIKSIKFLGSRFPNSRFTIATIGGRSELIKKLSSEKIDNVLKLHLSLHAPNNSLRKKILPNAGLIHPALNALKYFSLKKNIIPKINYVLIKDVNDLEDNAIQLAKLIEPYSFIIKLSRLNRFNELKPSGIDKFEMFEKILNNSGIKTCRFFPDGSDIKAACGQLRKYFNYSALECRNP